MRLLFILLFITYFSSNTILNTYFSQTLTYPRAVACLTTHSSGQDTSTTQGDDMKI